MRYPSNHLDWLLVTDPLNSSGFRICILEFDVNRSNQIPLLKKIMRPMNRFPQVILLASGISSASAYSGHATTYGLTDPSGGNCNFMKYPQAAVSNFVAINKVQWDSSMSCGRCAQVTCTDSLCSGRSKESEIVYVVDQCPGCNEGDLDLSPLVFKSITGMEPGIVEISWEFVTCPATGNIEYCLKEGSNAFWAAIQPTHTSVGVDSVTIDGKQTSMVASSFYFLLDGDSIEKSDLSNLKISMTSVQGETITDVLSFADGDCVEGSSQFTVGEDSVSTSTVTASITEESATEPPTTSPPTTEPPATTTTPTTIPPTTDAPTSAPTEVPTDAPTTSPPTTSTPTSTPTETPSTTSLPTEKPTTAPTTAPPTTSTPTLPLSEPLASTTSTPDEIPTESPTEAPTSSPPASSAPTEIPLATSTPTRSGPTSSAPTEAPPTSSAPTNTPTEVPTTAPPLTSTPTIRPAATPTTAPPTTNTPTTAPVSTTNAEVEAETTAPQRTSTPTTALLVTNAPTSSPTEIPATTVPPATSRLTTTSRPTTVAPTEGPTTNSRSTDSPTQAINSADATVVTPTNSPSRDKSESAGTSVTNRSSDAGAGHAVVVSVLAVFGCLFILVAIIMYIINRKKKQLNKQLEQEKHPAHEGSRYSSESDYHANVVIDEQTFSYTAAITPQPASSNFL